MSDKPPRDQNLVEPHPADADLFAWLENLFDGEAEYPERLEARVVGGPKFERMGPHVYQQWFDPTGESDEAEEEKKSSKKKVVRRRRGKPTKQELVAISNEIRHRCQSDSNAQRKSCVYAVYPWHFQRGDEPYDRKLIRCDPKGLHPRHPDFVGGGEEDFDEDGSPRQRYETQKLHQDAKLFELFSEGIMAIIDRQDRHIERAAQDAERLRVANERLLENNHRLVTQEEERQRVGKWTDLKIRSAERVLDLGLDLAPPLLGRLTGKKNGAGIEETPESLTIKRFLKLDTDGGKLTSAQADAAFGVFDKETKKCIKAGVLNEDQLQILLDVANLHAPADVLLKLIPPTGAHAISMEQVTSLRNIFPMAQFAPLMTLIGSLISQQEQSQPPQENA